MELKIFFPKCESLIHTSYVTGRVELSDISMHSICIQAKNNSSIETFGATFTGDTSLTITNLFVSVHQKVEGA